MFFFDIDSVFFRVGDYPMSYLEFTGTVAGLVAVWMASKANVWNWPVGLVNIVLFFVLFYQVQLYPDMLLQVFFFVTNLAGWWRWTHPAKTERDEKKELKVSFMTPHLRGQALLAGAAGTVVMGYAAQRVHLWWPAAFDQPSAFPYVDSFITVMSVLATFMAIHKKIECWVVWIAVDAVATGVYFSKNIKLVSAEYLLFCLIAASGLWRWLRIYRSYAVKVPR